MPANLFCSSRQIIAHPIRSSTGVVRQHWFYKVHFLFPISISLIVWYFHLNNHRNNDNNKTTKKKKKKKNNNKPNKQTKKQKTNMNNLIQLELIETVSVMIAGDKSIMPCERLNFTVSNRHRCHTGSPILPVKYTVSLSICLFRSSSFDPRFDRHRAFLTFFQEIFKLTYDQFNYFTCFYILLMTSSNCNDPIINACRYTRGLINRSIIDYNIMRVL